MPPKGTTGMAERDFFIKNLFLLAYVHFFSYLCTIFHIMRNYVLNGPAASRQITKTNNKYYTDTHPTDNK